MILIAIKIVFIAQGSAEIKVIKNTATLSMEEVAPVAMSDANLLAPQEIIDRNRGDEIGSSERAETDKKRDRRRKKALQSKRQKENEKREKGERRRWAEAWSRQEV